MTIRPRGHLRRFVTAAVRVAVLLGVVVLVAGCGSSSSDTTTSTAAQDQARKFAQCMRANGVPDFPDPEPNGEFRGAGHEQQSVPEFRAAQEACRDLAPGGEHKKLGGPAFVEQMREFSQCM